MRNQIKKKTVYGYLIILIILSLFSLSAATLSHYQSTNINHQQYHQHPFGPDPSRGYSPVHQVKKRKPNTLPVKRLLLRNK
jgi:hypothetical protein